MLSIWHNLCILIIAINLKAKINMKNLFNKIFKKEPQFNYIIAEYQPMKVDSQITRARASAAEYDIEAPENSDEMEIDKIYQRQ